MENDSIVNEMLSRGFVIARDDGHYDLTEKGEKALIAMFKTDPEGFARLFPDWARKEWIH